MDTLDLFIKHSKNELDIVEGNEGIIDVIKELDTLLYDKFVKLIRYIQTTKVIADEMVKYNTRTSNVKKLAKLKPAVLKAINNGAVTPELLSVKVPTIAGLKANLNELVNVLILHINDIENFKNVLEEVKNRIDNILLSNRIKSTDIGNTKELEEIKNRVERILTDIEKIREDKVIRDRVELRKLVSNVSSIPELINKTLTLGKNYRLEELERIMEGVVELSDLVKGLMPKLRDDKETAQLLSQYLLALAEYSTAIGLLFFLYTNLVDIMVMISNLIINQEPKELEKIAKKINDFKSNLVEKFMTLTGK